MMAKRKKPKAPAALPWNGDHGTGTAAAQANTEVVPLEGDNPNRFARRQRVNQIQRLKPSLSQRQYQAAMAIQDAWCRCEMLSSGAPLKEQVDTSARPDATIAVQIDAQSWYVHVTKAVPRNMRDVVDHVCCENLPITQLSRATGYNRMADLKVALDLVANRLRY